MSALQEQRPLGPVRLQGNLMDWDPPTHKFPSVPIAHTQREVAVVLYKQLEWGGCVCARARARARAQGGGISCRQSTIIK